MSRQSRGVNPIEERLEAFLTLQRRIVEDFERSLRNARHFIELAGVALAKEPENTEMMLEQVLEIDLLRHISTQYENFQGLAAMLKNAQGPLESGEGEALGALRKRYEAMVSEAEDQNEQITTLLSGLQTVN